MALSGVPMLLIFLACIQETGLIKENDCPTSTWYPDLDGDGVGADAPVELCGAADGYVEELGDCDDTDAAVYPGATELCNGVDDDCTGVADDGLPLGTWYSDTDGDGFGGASTESCAQPAGTIEQGGDCDDSVATIFPGAVELCNSLDDDCDGTTDEEAADAPLWYIDADADGWGADDPSVYACSQPAGYVAINGDCDDADGSRAESCVEEPTGSSACGGTLYTYVAQTTTEPELHILSVYEPNPRGTPIYVTINRETEMELVLSSYEPAEWIITTAANTVIDRILANGYNQQVVTVAGGIPVETRTVADGTGYWGYPCGYSWPYNGGGCDTGLMVAALESYTGLTTSSFTGCYNASAFLLE